MFSREYNQRKGSHNVPGESRQKRGEATIWQRRFWEHAIRDERDFERHMDCIHYNPVKHGLVKNVEDWQWSSFHRYYRQGYYPIDWTQKTDEDFKNLDLGE